ncbi:MAG: PIG-L family deacetylase [Actinomycetes bacterium]
MSRTPESQVLPEHGWTRHRPTLVSLANPVLEPGTRVLVLVAHPDDADFTAGGTLARITGEGAEVSLYVATSGQKGRDVTVDPDEDQFGARRRAEQSAAAQRLGIDRVQFGPFMDGDTHRQHMAMVEAFTFAIRCHRPHVLITSDPFTRLYHQHPDHRNVGLAALDAAFPAAVMNTYFPDQLTATDQRVGQVDVWSVPNIWLVFSDRDDLVVEMSEQHLATKQQALSEHWTQRDSHGALTQHEAVAAAAAAHRAFVRSESFAHAHG